MSLASIAFHQPWSPDVCNRYILFPEALKVVTAFVIGGVSFLNYPQALPSNDAEHVCLDFLVIFLMRLYALYGGNRAIMALGATLLLAEIVIKIVSSRGLIVALAKMKCGMANDRYLVGVYRRRSSGATERYVARLVTWFQELADAL